MKVGDEFGLAILAAGASVRMGRPKLLLPWGEKTVLGHLVSEWDALGIRERLVVTASEGGEMRCELDRVGLGIDRCVVNPAPSGGMMSSIRCAAAWDGWTGTVKRMVLTLGDQPLVRRETLAGLLELARREPGAVCQPRRGGRWRHPVIFPMEEWVRLRTTGAETLREFLSESEARVARWGLDVADEGLDVDLDYPADYERALAMRAQRTS